MGPNASAARRVVAAVPWRIIVLGYLAALGAGVLVGFWVIAAGGWDRGLAWERQLMLAIDPELPPSLDWLFLVVPWLGTNLTLVPGIAIAALWLGFRHTRWDLSLHLIVVEVGSWSMTPLLKFAFGRPRPELWEWRGQFAWASYPSGHAIASVAVLLTAAILLHRERGWRWPYLIAALLIAISAYSRIYLGVHWPTDVIGGALIGAIWLCVTLRAFRPVERAEDARTTELAAREWR